MFQGIIYLFINSLNGHKYIGQARKFDKRMKEHLSHSKIRPRCLIDKKIHQYGWNNFEKYLIDTCKTNQEDLNMLESYYIDYFGTKVEFGNGYNVRQGGSRGAHSVESKLQMSKAQKGVPKSQNHIKNIIKSRICQPVLCHETQIVYKSQREAARCLEIKQGGIRSCLIGKSKQAYGYTFSIVEP